MIVEILQFGIAPGLRSEFIQRNEQVWTPALRRRPGFVRREILVSDEDPDQAVILVYWNSREDPAGFPAEEQSGLDAQMGDLVRIRKRLLLERVLG